MYNKIKPKKLTLAALLIPGVLLFVMCCIVPLGVAFYFSLFNWDGGINKTFIALQNYIELLKDKNFWQAFWNNIRVWCVSKISIVRSSFFRSFCPAS